MASAISKRLAHLRIPLENVLKATNNFADENIIGKGGFGYVYRGKLNHHGEMIKISARRLDRKHGQGDVEFWTEISVLSGLDDHDNIVSMIGFCDEKGEMIIINHHYAKGSLYKHLNNPNLTWPERRKVATGVAEAIFALHDVDESRSYIVIHRNINSSTILLDDEWVPKLSGFEYSIKQSVHRKNHVILSEPIGTRGYIDPAIEKNGGVDHMSDVYCLGVVLFEILCGRKANEDGMLLASFAKLHYEKGTLNDIIHPDLLSQLDQQSIRWFAKAAKVAYTCLNEDLGLRPTSLKVFTKLVTATYLDNYDYDFNEYKKEHRKWKLLEWEGAEMFADVKLPSEPWKVHKLDRLRMALKDIQLATDNFSETSEIECELNYVLYKAKLRCSDREYISSVKRNDNDELPMRDYNVKIKRIHSMGYDYNSEIQSLICCKHPNVESLLGFCEEESRMILVYEYDYTKFLSSYLKTHILTWEKRLKICIDVAHGLRYLHDEIDDQTMVLIHNDIRCDKIVLDDHWRAKITGFECSKLVPLNQQDGAPHHREPKCVVADLDMKTKYGKTVMPDVIDFGVFMCEIISGESITRVAKFQEEARDLERLFKKSTDKKYIHPSLMRGNSENNFFLHIGPNEDSLNTFIETIRWCMIAKRKRRPSSMKVVIKQLEKSLAYHENSKDAFKMSFQDIKTATHDFNNEIGGGGFGRVYKGEFAHGEDKRHHTLVAKKLDTSHGQGEKQYYTELEILYVYKHENIVSLVGYSRETDEKIIVYEYAPRGSLDKHLKSPSLRWRNRLKICIDVARGLKFLHGGVRGQVVIHRDIKAANILLFDEWKAKLGDFGLSLISAIDDETDYVVEHPCGTQSYVDPLYLKSGLLTIESDIYSFGVVLFEILCGSATHTISKPKSVSLLNYIKHNFEDGKQDEMVFKAIKEEIVPKSLSTFLKIIYKCLDDERDKRPASKQVLTQLKRALNFQKITIMAKCEHNHFLIFLNVRFIHRIGDVDESEDDDDDDDDRDLDKTKNDENEHDDDENDKSP